MPRCSHNYTVCHPNSDDTMSLPAAAPIQVWFVLQQHSLVLDWAGPAEALRIANQLLRAAGQPERFQIRFAGAAPQAPLATPAPVHPVQRVVARRVSAF